MSRDAHESQYASSDNKPTVNIIKWLAEILVQRQVVFIVLTSYVEHIWTRSSTSSISTTVLVRTITITVIIECDNLFSIICHISETIIWIQDTAITLRLQTVDDNVPTPTSYVSLILNNEISINLHRLDKTILSNFRINLCIVTQKHYIIALKFITGKDVYELETNNYIHVTSNIIVTHSSHTHHNPILFSSNQIIILHIELSEVPNDKRISLKILVNSIHQNIKYL
ncbi:hypothetical protein AGLY_009222 [Aphis glycines]|uniref:Uncharacterized protein n=1 Tax=Aphis glycines TaxID=307491 RepID=A0A6G0TKW5_APHGL|nr:hypothetical protein AGLY_009222 [Aphis glycines]